MTTNATPGPRARFRFLKPDPEVDNQIPYGRPLASFPVHLPEFVPMKGEPPLRAGEPPTKLGARLRDLFADLNRIDPADVPHGLIRDVEALSADHDENINALARPLTQRNHAGELVVVPFRAHSPLIGPFIANGRQQMRIAHLIRAKTTLITGGRDHKLFKLPEFELSSPNQPMLLADAQRRVEGMDAYSGEDREFVDSIALDGVLKEPVVVPFHMVDAKRHHGAFVPQTDDGWRRITATHTILKEILGVEAAMTYRHWETGKGSMIVRSHTAESIRRTLAALRFPSSDKAAILFPSSRHTASFKAWESKIADTTPEVRVFHRVRTVWIFLVIAARPNPDATAYDVCYQDMAGRHIPALAPRPWTKDATEGLVAIRAVDSLVDHGHITSEARAAFLGEQEVPWSDDSDREPFRNRVVATTELMAKLTTAANTNRLDSTSGALKEHGMRNHPDERGRIAAAQATTVAGVEQVANGAYIGQVSAALAATFKHGALWKDAVHIGSPWSEKLSVDVGDLVTEAERELGQNFRPKDENVGALGPAQRALMALAGTAHAINPELLKADHSLTRTGRGGRGGVSTSDPIALLVEMVRDLDGIRRCAAIIEATTDQPPSLPVDPITDEQMTEEWLRHKYLGRGAGRDHGGDTETPPPPDPDQIWWRDLERLLQDAAHLALLAAEMKDRPVPAIVTGADPETWDAATAPKMFNRLGIQPEQGKFVKEELEKVRAIIDEGVALFRVLKGTGSA